MLCGGYSVTRALFISGSSLEHRFHVEPNLWLHLEKKNLDKKQDKTTKQRHKIVEYTSVKWGGSTWIS